MRKKLTAKLIERMAPPASGRVEVFDTILPGFGIRITDKDRRTYFCMYRLKGRQVRQTLGSCAVLELDEARDDAREAMRKAEKGEDPRPQNQVDLPEHARRSMTFKELAQKFEDLYRGRKTRTMAPKTKAMYVGYLKREFIPRWGTWAAEDIEPHHIRAALQEIMDRDTPTAANRAKATIRLVLSWAVDRGYLRTSPAIEIRSPASENRRDRVLTDAEVKKFWAGCDALGYPFGPLFKLMLLLGRREGAVAGMRWADLDLKAKTWTIPAALDKTRTPHVVPLPPLAVDILKDLPRIAGKAEDGTPMATAVYVFTSNGDRPVSGFSKAKKLLDEKSGVADWVLHDTRRTCRTNLSRLKVTPDIAKLAIGHSVNGIDAVYDRYSYLDERRAALERWAQRLQAILSDNVTMLGVGHAG